MHLGGDVIVLSPLGRRSSRTCLGGAPFNSADGSPVAVRGPGAWGAEAPAPLSTGYPGQSGYASRGVAHVRWGTLAGDAGGPRRTASARRLSTINIALSS